MQRLLRPLSLLSRSASRLATAPLPPRPSLPCSPTPARRLAAPHLRLPSGRLYATPALDMERVDTSKRLAELRKLMKEHGVHVYSKKKAAN